MPEFLELSPPQAALDILLNHLAVNPQSEEIDSSQSLGRVSAVPVIAPHPMPSFPRSTVDGFAVIAADTYGAGDTLPAYLKVLAEVPMGAEAGVKLSPGNCALIHTGGMLPPGADAVVMVEYTQNAGDNEIEFLRAVAVGENVLRVGEDVAAGEEVIPAGVQFGAAEIGGLMAIGATRVSVVRKPRVGIISSGDEVVHPEAELRPGQVRDVNAYSLGALVQGAGGIPILYGIVPDRYTAMKEAAERAMDECDLVVVTAGSSASTRDLTAQVFDALGEPGVLVHGVNVRPGKPTILAVCEGKAMIGLPGNPVSALVIATLFVVPVIQVYLGVRKARPKPAIPARLAINLSSQAGREDWVPVTLVSSEEGLQAEPVFSKSNLIFGLVRADGLVCIPADANGLAAGELVQVVFL